MTVFTVHAKLFILGTTIVAISVLVSGATGPDELLNADLRLRQRVFARVAAAASAATRMSSSARRVGTMTSLERRAAIDAFWGEGTSAAEQLQTFDKFWAYVDAKFAGFQNLDVDWLSIRTRYRGEVASGVSRGRFAAIINHLSLALRDSHTIPLDFEVNFRTVPEPGVPLMGVGGWEVDTSGACLTAQDDGSALVYSAMPDHPLGLERGDRILGYDGRPWSDLYQELLREELPLWPLWWGTTPSSFDHTFVMSAGLNWHLFDTMDIAKRGTGHVVHVPTNLMPGALFWGFCSEQMDIPGVPKPRFFSDVFVSAGIVAGTRIGYIYTWSWDGTASDDFAAAVDQLTQVEQVEGLILDFRFNEGGVMKAPLQGLSALSDQPSRTIGMDARRSPENHVRMKSILRPNEFKLDFDYSGERPRRVKSSYDGPIAVLVGPGAVSAGDLGALWATFLPRVRTFGKSTAMAVGMPTQPALGTTLDLGPDWIEESVAETNSYRVGAPKEFLIHTEFPVDELVWLTPADVADGQDSVVNAALAWLRTQIP
jgi:C-terminal processing protease CtpA/Prc